MNPSLKGHYLLGTFNLGAPQTDSYLHVWVTQECTSTLSPRVRDAAQRTAQINMAPATPLPPLCPVHLLELQHGMSSFFLNMWFWHSYLFFFKIALFLFRRVFTIVPTHA